MRKVQISSDPDGFRHWLGAVGGRLKNDGIERYFGNHRKYISLDPDSPGGTGQAIVTYVGWVAPHGSHAALFGHAAQAAGFDARRTFERLYRSMGAVASFGRTGRFDYLTMLGKLELAPIEPGSAYISGSTGPVAGARLLFGSNSAQATPKQLDAWLLEIERALGLRMGMQILEDSLCNWQKNPTRFVPFRG